MTECLLATETLTAFGLATHLHDIGCSVIPLRADSKIPARRWKQYQTERCTKRDLLCWFSLNDFVPAIVTGELSGLIVIDCDSVEDSDYLDDCGLGSQVRQHTRRGVHHVYRWDEEVRNTVRILDRKIDRRGDGGYVRAYPDSMLWTRDEISASAELPGELRWRLIPNWFDER